MDPLSPDSGQDGDLNEGPPTPTREQGLAPASSLMSLQIRRRMPAKDRLLGPAPAPRAVRPDSPQAFAGPQPQTAKAPPKPAPAPAPVMVPEPTQPAEPTRIAAAKPESAPAARPTPPSTPTAAPTRAAPVPTEPLPDVVPPVLPPRGPRLPVVSPIGDPGRRPPAASAPVIASPPRPAVTPPRATMPPPLPPAPPLPIDPAPTTPAPIAREPIAPAPIAPAPTVPSPLSSPGIARYARTPGQPRRPESKAAQVAAQTAPEPRGATNVPPPSPTHSNTPAPAPEPVRPEGIVSYWLRLRGSRRYPAKADLDQQRIARDWPNSILMRCRSGSKVLEPEKVLAGPKSGASAAPGGQSAAAMELSPMMLQWLLTLATDAAGDRRPMQDIETFPSLNKSIRYGAIALPFSDDQTRIDHVLCHVFRAP